MGKRAPSGRCTVVTVVTRGAGHAVADGAQRRSLSHWPSAHQVSQGPHSGERGAQAGGHVQAGGLDMSARCPFEPTAAHQTAGNAPIRSSASAKAKQRGSRSSSGSQRAICGDTVLLWREARLAARSAVRCGF